MTSNTFNYTVLIDLEDISQWFSNQCNRLLGLLTSTWLSKRQILEQSQSDNWVCNRQVLWSGIPHDKLLWIENVAAPIGSLTATVLLAQSQGKKVRVLSPPPPERFHPSGLVSYRAIEEPITKSLLGQCTVQRIIMVKRFGLYEISGENEEK